MIDRKIGQKLELLYKIPNMPVKCSVSELNTPASEDARMDMSYHINEDGLIQITPLPKASLLYETFHNDSLGNTWQEHHEAFGELVSKYSPKNILEIGGGSGILSKIYHDKYSNTPWTIFDINTTHLKNRKDINTLEGDINDNFHTLSKDHDVIVHSHFFEHLYNPFEFLQNLSKITSAGTVQIFSVPNLKNWLGKGYLNALFFEHNIYLDEFIIKHMLERSGFRLNLIQYYKDHSLFYVCTNVKEYSTDPAPKRYHELKDTFKQHILKTQKYVNSCVTRAQSPIYIYGAHIFSQMLLSLGLTSLNIKGVLDNSSLKIGKRLYGYDLEVYSPTILQKHDKPTVVLRAGAYQQEIKENILSINPNTIILE
jgi:2-polyprenyl-3-methyl-5-hydroxy-6-metoxy-1,4-benzoquinol methylase